MCTYKQIKQKKQKKSKWKYKTALIFCDIPCALRYNFSGLSMWDLKSCNLNNLKRNEDNVFWNLSDGPKVILERTRPLI